MVLSSLKYNIISAFLKWHFFDVPQGILKAWKNFLKFNLNYFSVPVLLKTFFSHWHRYRMSYGKGFNPGRYFEAFVFNMMSRVIGAILRTFFILVGLLIEIIIFFSGLILLLGWITLPLFLIGGFFYGLGLLF